MAPATGGRRRSRERPTFGRSSGCRRSATIGAAATIIGLVIAATVAAAVVPVAAGEAGVRLEHGLVSARFDDTPVSEALAAIRRATGLDVTLPPSALGKKLTAVVAPAPLEIFLRRVLDALDLGGFALVYEKEGMAQRLIVVDKARAGASERASPAAKRPRPSDAGSGSSRVSVPVLITKKEADSMKLGTPGQTIVADSPPVARIKTSECEGGAAAVQTAVVTDAQNTYITGLIVCSATGLAPGQTLTVAPTRTGGPAASDEEYSRFIATTR